MNEEAKQEELVEEGEVVEVDLPEEKPSGKIADLATPEETDQEAERLLKMFRRNHNKSLRMN
tara:strand:- start:5 stop:190 length:186 start_codon:yes stop_codon:yes gene_type:complete